MNQPSAEIRVLDGAGVERLIGWARDEGWNPGLADAAAFRVADPDGFLGCFLDDELVAGMTRCAGAGAPRIRKRAGISSP